MLSPTTLGAEGPFSSPPPRTAQWGWLPPCGWISGCGSKPWGKGLTRESQPSLIITPLFRGHVRGGTPSEAFHTWKVRQVSWKGYYLKQTNPSAGWVLSCKPQTKSQHNQRAVRSFFYFLFFFLPLCHLLSFLLPTENTASPCLLLNIHQIGGEALAVFTGEARRWGEGHPAHCSVSLICFSLFWGKSKCGWRRADQKMHVCCRSIRSLRSVLCAGQLFLLLAKGMLFCGRAGA